MRTVEIKTNGKVYLVCDLPENRGVIDVCDKFLSTYLNTNEREIHEQYYGIPDGVWAMVGFASSLSEKEWAAIVEGHRISKEEIEYKKYTTHLILDTCKTATESGKSWLEANGIADFVNPFLLIKK